MTFNPIKENLNQTTNKNIKDEASGRTSNQVNETLEISTQKLTLSPYTESKKILENDAGINNIVRLGRCKWFNVAKGWGFITPNDGGQDVFVHQSVLQMSGFRSLGEQEDVEFECKQSEKGLEATRVTGLDGTSCRGSTFRPKSRRLNKKRIRRVRCYNCGEYGNHIASKCSQEPQPKRCHYCKSENHLIADCLEKKMNNKESESDEFEEEISDESNNKYSDQYEMHQNVSDRLKKITHKTEEKSFRGYDIVVHESQEKSSEIIENKVPNKSQYDLNES